jgi:PAS domain S-box-containing protein
MERPAERIRTRIIAPFVLALAAVIAASIIGFHGYQKSWLDEDTISHIRGAKRLIRFSLIQEANLLTSLLQRLDADKPAQRSYFAGEREDLLARVKYLYGDIIKQFGVTDLTFIGVDKTCFLRVQDPDAHGDSVEFHALDLAVEQQLPVQGIEVGADGRVTLRMIHPWTVGRELGGYIEIGKEIDGLIPVLHDILGMDVVFFVPKAHLDRAQWQQGVKSAESAGDWDRFPDHVAVTTTLAELPPNLIENLGAHGHFVKDGIFQIRGDRQFMGGFVPLADVRGVDVVNIAVLKDVTSEQGQMQGLEIRLAVVRILVGGALIAIFFLYLGRIERRLVKGAADLKAEIAERRQAQTDLQASQDKYRDLVQNANSIIMRRDEDGVVTFFNEYAQKFFGYSEEEILGRNVIGTIVPETGMHNEDLAAMIRDIGKHTEFYSANENENMRRDGERVWVAWTNKVIGGDALGKREILCVGNDITARKTAEEERRRLEKRVLQAQKLESLAVLAGGIAHDFNNLLQGVLGNASLALERLPEDSRTRRSLSDIQKGASRAAELCRLMLAFSGQGKSVIETFDLNGVVQDMTEALQASVPGNIKIERQLSKDILPIEGDPNQIRQILLALITNAAEAMDRSSGSIIVSARAETCGQDILSKNAMNEDLPDGPYVLLEVSDDGCGMNEETRKRIFEPFFSTKFVGRGLSLAAVSGIVRGHKGGIATRSQPGKGTTITILLPLSSKPPSARGGRPRPAGAAEGPPKTPGANTVLVADDEEDVLAITELMLHEHGFEVLTASDGNEAVESFRNHADEILAVILDLTMPNKGGAEALEEIRTIKSGVSVILASGYSQEEMAGQYVGQGAAEYIQKPFEFKALGDLLRSMLSSAAS